MGQATQNLPFSREQALTFAAGLYALASSDAIDAREQELIDEFLKEAGVTDMGGQLSTLSFDPVHAYQVFESSWLRRLFLKAALLLVKIDGEVTEPEKETLAWMTDAFGVSGGYEALSAQVEGESL